MTGHVRPRHQHPADPDYPHALARVGGVTLLPPSPLRTGRAPLDASGSSKSHVITRSRAAVLLLVTVPVQEGHGIEIIRSVMRAPLPVVEVQVFLIEEAVSAGRTPVSLARRYPPSSWQ